MLQADAARFAVLDATIHSEMPNTNSAAFAAIVGDWLTAAQSVSIGDDPRDVFP
jgi:hypothetical protein